MEPASVARFREYLKIQTVHPTPEYEKCAEFLVNQAKEIGLGFQVVEPVKGKPVVIMKLEGTDPSLPTILLNSHIDVVPVFREKWDYDPFAATRIPVDGGKDFRIYARGSNDMKVQGSLYLEAFREIKASGKKFPRTVYASFVPDEEILSVGGMDPFSKTQEFKDLNVGFGIDEGSVSTNDYTYIFPSERATVPVVYTAHGNTGHGSQFIQGTAMEKLLPVINELLKLRESEKARLETLNGSLETTLGLVTTVNLTILEGGKQANVVPESFSATFDIRYPPNKDLHAFYKYLEDLGAKNGCEVDILYREDKNISKPVTDDNEFLKACVSTCIETGRKPIVTTITGCTDARWLRMKGIQSVGLGAIHNHESRPHGDNEYMSESNFIDGIPFYTMLIERLASVPDTN
ncbi:Aminoacylase-1 [Smittium mucronatum]|uniref:N-acyl-aliphatic-L-amino acid amidohydrolase n=1 Tax=Smittium mucronatum TaxID=133383 RepID=A0A1R0GXR5_9FUNG|nr:Aminoacylase-1 [Smittium mucronatum]